MNNDKQAHSLAYEKAVTEFIEEYMSMPADWYEKGRRILSPMYIDVAVSILIAKEVFTLQEIREEFYDAYKMVLNYNTENLNY